MLQLGDSDKEETLLTSKIPLHLCLLCICRWGGKFLLELKAPAHRADAMSMRRRFPAGVATPTRPPHPAPRPDPNTHAEPDRLFPLI